MTASGAMLALYRAARDFTRRMESGEGLERAALDYARSRGWVPPEECVVTHCGGVVVGESTLSLREAFTSQDLGARVSELEAALRKILHGNPAGYRMTRSEMESLAREVLG